MSKMMKESATLKLYKDLGELKSQHTKFLLNIGLLGEKPKLVISNANKMDESETLEDCPR